MQTYIKDGKTFTTIDGLKNWDQNPRSISKKGFDRLKKQITQLGQHTPLLVDDKGTVFSGNMRLRAYNDMGIKEVWVNVISGDDSKKLEYALSANDRAGFYDEDLLANLVPNYNIEWKDYTVDIREPANIEDLVNMFEPVDMVDRLDEKKTVICPNCHHEFTT